MASPARSLPTSDNPVQAVRRFNRFYTRQIGVLQEHLLQSQFSLTEVRVLYELAHCSGITAVELREELGLDRGYLSRMLQGFEKHGWIKVTPSSDDRRRILLSLTRKGRGVFAPLDRKSSDQVAEMLARLSVSGQQRLLQSMNGIESILGGQEPQASLHSTGDSPSEKPANRDIATVTMPVSQRPTEGDMPAFTLRQHRPGDMGWVVQRHGELYWQEYKYDERFEALVAEIVAEFIQKFDPKYERCWIPKNGGGRVGTIFLVKKSKTVAKLRLLLVEPSARGLGIGKRLVSECVAFAHEAGYKKIILWTQSELHSARHLYEQAGFKRTAQEPHRSWGRNDLVAETWELKL